MKICSMLRTFIVAADRREAAHYSCDTRVENRHSGS